MKLEELTVKNMPNFDKCIKIREIMNAGFEVKTQKGFIFRLAECKGDSFSFIQKVGDNYWINPDMNLDVIVFNLCDKHCGVSEEELNNLIANFSLTKINKKRICNM